jgi:hypothetical protein
MIYAILIGFSVFEMTMSTRDAYEKKRVYNVTNIDVRWEIKQLQSVISSDGGKCSKNQS